MTEGMPTIGNQIEEKEPEFKASRDLASMKNIAIDELETCKACCQRTASHAMGVGDVLTDNEMKDMYDKQDEVLVQTKINLESANETFFETQKMIEEIKLEQNKTIIKKDEIVKLAEDLKNPQLSLVYKIGLSIGYVATLVAGIVIGS